MNSLIAAVIGFVAGAVTTVLYLLAIAAPIA